MVGAVELGSTAAEYPADFAVALRDRVFSNSNKA
jgi:hypothetical protein